MQPPVDPPGRAGRWVSMPEAIRILRKPETTLRRMLDEGKLEGGRYPRNPDNPQDTRSVWRILLPDTPLADAPSETANPPPESPASATWLQTQIAERDATIVAKDAQISAYVEQLLGQAKAFAQRIQTGALLPRALCRGDLCQDSLRRCHPILRTRLDKCTKSSHTG